MPRRRTCDAVADPVARSVEFRSMPAARSAGTRPDSSAVSALAPAAKSSAVVSICTASRRGRFAGRRTASACVPARAMMRPTASPPSASARLSVASWRSSRRFDAPSAPRTAISRSRAVARASSRCATFAHAISRTNPTAMNSARIAGFACFTTSSWSGTTRTRMSPASCTGCSARSCFAMPSSSDCACANVTPGFRRAKTVNSVKLRGGWFA